MNCFPCFTSQKSKKSQSRREHGSSPTQENVTTRPNADIKKHKADENIQAQNFTFRELASATKNFRQQCLLGEGGFGRVYKGTVPATGQVVAVKQLDRNNLHGSKEFLAEISVLSHLKHENLVNLVGYCADGDQRLLVYEFMSRGSVEDHLLEIGADKPPLDWFTRMKIALGAARGLEYLHDKADPPIIYRGLKSSNILLDDDLNPKLSDFGLAKLAGGDKMNLISPGVTGTYGYSAPEYVRTGNLTLKSDVYGFGVVLLELITGRRAIDTTRPNEEQNLVSWAQPLFRNPKNFPDMADPLLKKHFPEKDLNQAVAIAAMCLQEEEAARPLMSDVVTALSFLSIVPPEVIPSSLSTATSPFEESISSGSETGKESNGRDGSDDEDREGSGNEDNESCGNHHDDENEKKHGFDSQKVSQEFYSKSRRKSSKKSRNGGTPSGSSRRNSCSSEDGSSNHRSRSKKENGGVSSQKSRGINGNLSHKSSKKSSERDLNQKSSRKSSVRVVSHKSSMGSEEDGSEDGRPLRELSGSRVSPGDISIGLISSGGSQGGSVHSDHSSSRSSDEGECLDHTSSSGSEEGSVHLL